MKKYILITVSLIIGVIIGWAVFGGGGHSHGGNGEDGGDDDGSYWTCSMEPQVRSDKPGKCPICGMDLIKATPGMAIDSNIDPDAVMLSAEALALAGVETEVVGTGNMAKEVRLFGKIQPDERLLQSQSAYVNGRIEQLNISAVGDNVVKGQTIAKIYSPELYTATQELVATLSMHETVHKPMKDAAIEKLRLLNMSESQIQQVIESKKASPYIELKANTSGTVLEKLVSQGDYVKQGEPLLKIANLSRVWAVFEAYEADLPMLKKGSEIAFTAESLPGKIFRGRISFIDPVINAQSRTAAVRVEMANAGDIFKAEMLLVGHVKATMTEYKDEIIVPKSAVLWTGKRSVVYVKDEEDGMPFFMLRTITLGPSMPDGYVVLDGLAEGEEIVTQGAFVIDATAQLDGKKSMMSD